MFSLAYQKLEVMGMVYIVPVIIVLALSKVPIITMFYKVDFSSNFLNNSFIQNTLSGLIPID